MNLSDIDVNMQEAKPFLYLIIFGIKFFIVHFDLI
jgi:hypothetical protein